MHRKWFGVGVTAAVIGLFVSMGVATAAPMDPVNDDWKPQDEALAVAGSWDQYVNGPGRLAPIFTDENVYLGSNLQAANTGPAGEILYVGRCESIDAAPCASASTVFVNVTLPACTTPRSQDCVESFYVRQDGDLVEAALAEEWVTPDSFTFGSVSTDRGVTPPSGMTPLFRLNAARHSGGDLYAVSSLVSFMLKRQGGGWVANVGDLAVQIMPVSKLAFTPGDDACIDIGTQSQDRTTCLNTRHRLPDESFGVRVNVSADFGSWIFGRVQDPRITLRQAGGRVSLDVEGRPAVTPRLVTVLALDAVTQDIWRGALPARGTMLTSFPAGQVGSLARWSALNAPSGSTADSLVRLWIYRSSSRSLGPLSRCVSPGEIAGWISTNAMVYEAMPPTYDARLGALDFMIGGPAHQPGSTSPVSAEYDLLLRSEVASCFWAGQKVAQVATVSVIGGADGEEVTSTSVGESDGWVKFVARNVFFPEPAGSRMRAGTTNPTVRVVIPPAADPNVFATCKAMAKKYKDGVSYTGAVNTVTVKGKKVVRPALGKPFVSDAIYSANSKLDKDTDGLVCEREPKVK